nr:hypothetical protein [Tanacetum cinerariifolium]
MGRDTIQLETTVTTISYEYLLEFTSEYGISEALHSELPGPEDMIVDFLERKVKIGTHPHAAHEVPLLTSSRVIQMEDPAAGTDSSREAVDPEVSPPENVTTTGVAPEVGQAKGIAATGPHLVKEHRKMGNDGVDTNAPPKVLRRDHVDPRPTESTRERKSLAAIELGMGSNLLVHVSHGVPVDVSDPNLLSFAEPQSRPSADVTQSSNGAAMARDPKSENTSFTFMVEQRCAEIDARLDALSIDFDEELYPHILTMITGRRWEIGHGLHLVVMKCGESTKLRQAFADIVSVGIAKCMSKGHKNEVKHKKANLSLEAIEAYDPEAEAKYITAFHALKDLKYPIVDQLGSLKDASMDVIMASLHLKSDTGDDAP